MLNSIWEGFFKKIGEHIATKTIGFISVPTIVTWFTVSEKYTFELSKLQMAIAVSMILVVLVAVVLGTRALTKKKLRAPKKVGRLDDLQKDVVRLLWRAHGACLPLTEVQRILLTHNDPSRIVLACQRLQTYGLVVCNSYDPQTLVQLTDEGREYADKYRLTNANAIIAKAAASITDETEVEEKAKLAGIAAQINTDASD